MKCPGCGGTRFDEGTLALYNSISYLVFNSGERKFVTLGNSLNARVCLKCGRVEFSVPPRALEKKAPANERATGPLAGDKRPRRRPSPRP